MSKIAFIGCGSMAEAMMAGIIAKEYIAPDQIMTINKNNLARRQELQDKYGIQTTTDYAELLQDASIVILAVKPKDVFEALTTAKPYITKQMLLVSVVAGVATKTIESIIEQPVSIIRCMPNTSATIGKSATALSSNQFATEEQVQNAKALLETFGIATVVKEEQLDAVTGLSGSGPAYFYYLVEAMEEAAEKVGLNQETAKALIAQTLIGAAEMLLQSPKTPATLRKEVTSPGGTTEAGLNVLQSREMKKAFVDCILAATEQSKQLGKKLTEEISEKSFSI